MWLLAKTRQRKVFAAVAVVDIGRRQGPHEVRYIVEKDHFAAGPCKWLARVEFPDGMAAVDVGPVYGQLNGRFKTAGKALEAARAAAPEVSREARLEDDAFHLLQDAAEKFAAAGLQGKADEVYRLAERLAETA